MAEVTTGQAALHFSCSPDTIRRKVQRGELHGRTDARGRLWITLPDVTPETRQNEAEAHETVPLHMLLTEVQMQRDALLVQLEQAAVERAELRRLLGNAQQQLMGLLAAPSPAPSEEMPAGAPEPAESHHADTGTPAEPMKVRRPLWRFWQR